jgi:hypothetical protein
MQVNWNSKLNRYEGILVKQGQLSQEIGFSIGELCWTATLVNEHRMDVHQKWRWGSNGVSTRVEWRSGVVDLDQSTVDAFTMSLTSTSEFSQVANSFYRVK